MVEVQAQSIVADAIDQRGVRRVNPFVGHVLEEERRQHQRTGASCGKRVARELDRVRQRGAAGGGQHALRRDTGRDQGIESGPTLGDRERLTFAGRAERGDAVDAGREQPLRVVCEPCGIECAALVERA